MECGRMFLGKVNSRFCADCRVVRRRRSSAAYQRRAYATDPAYREKVLAYSRRWGAAVRRMQWPVPCAVCGAPVELFRGRKRTGAMCLRCRIAHAEAVRREIAFEKRRFLKLPVTRPKGVRHNHDPWTVGDERMLRALRSAGRTWREIGKVLGRTARGTQAHGLQIGAIRYESAAASS